MLKKKSCPTLCSANIDKYLGKGVAIDFCIVSKRKICELELNVEDAIGKMCIERLFRVCMCISIRSFLAGNTSRILNLTPQPA